jgi:hypothetical protein
VGVEGVDLACLLRRVLVMRTAHAHEANDLAGGISNQHSRLELPAFRRGERFQRPGRQDVIPGRPAGRDEDSAHRVPVVGPPCSDLKTKDQGLLTARTPMGDDQHHRRERSAGGQPGERRREAAPAEPGEVDAGDGTNAMTSSTRATAVNVRKAGWRTAQAWMRVIVPNGLA